MPPPRAVLLDMDGVIAEVKRSYRAAIVQTCAALGAEVTNEMVSAEKLRGNANNDWVLSQRLLRQGGKEVPLPEVTAKFEELYQGTAEKPGLRSLETMIPAVGVLEELHRRTGGKMAVVTGRPRKDCAQFLGDHNLERFFPVCVCMEDGPPKPDPGPVLLACERLGVPPASALMVGDTPDDVASAAAAGCAHCVGVLLPDDDARLTLNPGSRREDIPICAAMLRKGATSLIRAGLAELLDIVRPPQSAM